MRKSVTNIVNFVGQDVIIRVARQPLDEHLVSGFAVGTSDKLLLMHLVELDTLLPNGYSAIRLSDISSFKVDGSFMSRALRLLDRPPVTPDGIELAGWAELLVSAQNKCPLVMIETEKKEPGCCFIGRIANQTKRYVALEKVNGDGYWDETERFEFKDITQVKFDDGYTKALAYLVEREGETTIKVEERVPTVDMR